MKIGITEDTRAKGKTDPYVRWIKTFAPEAEVVVLSPRRGNFDLASTLNGIVLSGGGDIHPRFYFRQELLSQCRQIDPNRDEFEIAVIRHAFNSSVPLLGICRGMQLINVFFGGTLIADLQQAGFTDHTGAPDRVRVHPLLIERETRLSVLLEDSSHLVTTSHHQAVDKAGSGLVVSAYSPDRVPEALEWLGGERTTFMLGVQWHPEKFEDLKDPASERIAMRFLESARKHIPKSVVPLTDELNEEVHKSIKEN